MTVGVAGVLVIYSGAFDATATKPHEPIVGWAAHRAFVQSVRLRAAAVRPPKQLSREQVLAGLADYDRHCTACHGAPGVGRAAFAAGMLPTPPYLLRASHDWTAAQLYLIVHDGVKMTGMPAWNGTHSPARIWNLVAFLEALPTISADDYRLLRDASPLPSPAVAAARQRTPLLLTLPPPRDFPPWLRLLSVASLLVAGLCALIILQDLVRRPQKMWVMNLVWPLTALFGGLLWLAGYYAWGRAPPRGRAEAPEHGRPFPAKVAIGASHCGAGCALGDIIAEWLVFAAPAVAVAFGWGTLFAEKTFAAWILDFIAAFLMGIGFQYFTIKPMGDLSIGAGLWRAVKADAASISAWQVGMYGLMAVLQFAVFKPSYGAIAPVNSPEFWFAMQLAMLAGFGASYPVNWWLVRSGVKEAM